MSYVDESKYDGDWVDGERHGYGKLSRKNESITLFEGSWKHNQALDGTGQIQFSDKWSSGMYKGGIVAGVPQG